MIGRLGGVLQSYAAVARSPSYFPLWLAQLVSNFGDTLHYIALVVLVFNLTGRGAAVAVLVAAEIIPVLIIGPVAGVVIDRFSRKAILIGSDATRRGVSRRSCIPLTPISRRRSIGASELLAMPVA